MLSSCVKKGILDGCVWKLFRNFACMRPDNTRYHESEQEFFAELEALLTDPSQGVTLRYHALRQIMLRVLDQALEGNHLNFVGTFAKTDYIIKERHIPAHETELIHEARVLLSHYKEHDDDVLATYLPHAVKAVALLVSQNLPPSLSRLLPRRDVRGDWGKYDESRIRCIVEDWDEELIYVVSDEPHRHICVCYSMDNIYLTRNGLLDWSYLRNILKRGSQLNLVRVRWQDSATCGGQGQTAMPELIIFEPDYLVNITTIASCFESYCESPLVSILNRLKPQPNTIAIHLGNLSGQMLDDVVHGLDVPFAETMGEFFRHNALQLIACPDMLDRDKVTEFYNEARRQEGNIKQLIGDALPLSVSGYDSRDVMLEPSFFCETLGIQGRMDMLAATPDGAVIVEQKSGKGGFVPYRTPDYDPEVPAIQEKHWVQLLLYRALFTYGLHETPSHIMLLYSKYAKGLISTAANPELLLRAVRMRNLLTYTEMKYADEPLSLLESLSPDDLNTKGGNGKLWQGYVRPGLSDLLAPIQQADETTRAYYLRFLQFIAKEQMLAKMGNKTKQGSGFAAKWHCSPEEKQNSGDIYLGLSIIEQIESPDSNDNTVRLGFAEGNDTDSSNFRQGDIVVLYPYAPDKEPDICAQMVYRGTIDRITADDVCIRLRGKNIPQSDTSGDARWAIEHDLLDTSSTICYAMQQLLLAPVRRRELILGLRMPEVDTTLRLCGEYGRFDELALRAKQSRDLFMIVGPPGTGKTSFGMLCQLKEELLSQGTVLLLSYTNRAVDEICSKLDEEGIDFLRIASASVCEERFHKYLLANRIRGMKKAEEVRRYISEVRVVCATTSTMNANAHLFSVKHFTLAIIDEASQILEPQLVGLMSATHSTPEGPIPAIDRFIMIGDHKQLPAVVQQTGEESRVEQPLLHAIGLTDCSRSMFERLLCLYGQSDMPQSSYSYTLTHQGRMHPEIASFANDEFYQGILDVVPLPHQTEHGVERVRYIPSPDSAQSLYTPTKTNPAEAAIIAREAFGIYLSTGDAFDAGETLGIIVPYRNQISTIRKAITTLISGHTDYDTAVGIAQSITIDTVERFQGSQRDYIVYGFTILHPYELNFLTNNSFVQDGHVIDRKLNVALTRARRQLIIVGNPSIMRKNPTFGRLIEWARSASR